MSGILARHLAGVHPAEHLFEHEGLGMENRLDGHLEARFVDVVNVNLAVYLVACNLSIACRLRRRW